MNRTQIAQLYDSFPEGQKDMPREQFIRETLGIVDPVECGEILAQMVHGKQQHRRGQIQKAEIDRAMEGGPV